MVNAVLPVFFVIFVGWLFGRGKREVAGDKLLNDYALYVALPALLFVAIARADRGDLGQWAFVFASLGGIAVAWVVGLAIARRAGVAAPSSSVIAMGACYGTTGYLGVPVLIAAYGSEAALPAALATVIHNIPAIAAVILRHEMADATWRTGMRRAGRVVGRNPLLLAVLAGLAVALADVALPPVVMRGAEFVGLSAGPVALFALGLGLSRLQSGGEGAAWVGRIVLVKLLLQPLVTLALAWLLGLRDGVWLAVAVVMAAQPVGAGVYVFARQYGVAPERVALAIVWSLLAALGMLPLWLRGMG
ncbi:MAG: AEC family transporter [Cardiobacteriaceae bacterium]|nr:AEC family transporter [Cardiobacteriaceae bacterium]